MKLDADFAPLLRKTAIVLLLGTALVVFCYFFVDRPVAFYVHDHPIAQPLLKQLTEPPPILQGWAPVVLALLLIRRAWGPFRRWELALTAACVALVLADQFRESMSFAAGRYWPDTWINNNPSLIRNGAYGFHPFYQGPDWQAYGSFPSGHSARTLAVAGVVWVAYPSWRWLAVTAALVEAVGLLGMNYHFVSDVIAGCCIGGIVGAYAAHLAGLHQA